MIRNWILNFFWRQFGKPSGVFGRYIGNGMAKNNVYDARWTISLLNIQPEDRILEIGFGPGVSSQLAIEQATRGFLAGIDHSAAMVQAARKRNAGVITTGRMEMKQGSVTSLPYPDNSFDKGFSIHSVYFWPDVVNCLKELRRVLKPGGILAITIQPKDKWAEFQQEESDYRRLYLGAELAALFDEAGFRDVHSEVSPEQDKHPFECVLGTK